MRRHQLAQMLIIGVIASAIGIVVALSIDWFPKVASTQAEDIDTLFDVLLIASVPIFVLVEVVVLFCVWKFHMRPGEELKDGPPIHGNTLLEVVWTAIPALLLVGLCAYAYTVLREIEKTPSREMVVNVSGEQFAWSFEYPGQGGGRKVTTDQLFLPRGESVEFHIRSKDVIHSFWVPEFRQKIDAVPGITTKYRITPNRLGSYPVVCAELCGLGHSTMRQTVHVLPAAEFAAWLRRKRSPQRAAAAPAGGAAQTAAVGRQVFTSAGCGACHTLSAAGTTSTVGPDLDKTIKSDSKSTIRQAIVDPNAEIASGFQKGVMPTNFGQRLSKQQLDALVSFLFEVTHK